MSIYHCLLLYSMCIITAQHYHLCMVQKLICVKSERILCQQIELFELKFGLHLDKKRGNKQATTTTHTPSHNISFDYHAHCISFCICIYCIFLNKSNRQMLAIEYLKMVHVVYMVQQQQKRLI